MEVGATVYIDIFACCYCKIGGPLAGPLGGGALGLGGPLGGTGGTLPTMPPPSKL